MHFSMESFLPCLMQSNINVNQTFRFVTAFFYITSLLKTCKMKFLGIFLKNLSHYGIYPGIYEGCLKTKSETHKNKTVTKMKRRYAVNVINTQYTYTIKCNFKVAEFFSSDLVYLIVSKEDKM